MRSEYHDFLSDKLKKSIYALAEAAWSFRKTIIDRLNFIDLGRATWSFRETIEQIIVQSKQLTEPVTIDEDYNEFIKSFKLF